MTRFAGRFARRALLALAMTAALIAASLQPAALAFPVSRQAASHAIVVPVACTTGEWSACAKKCGSDLSCMRACYKTCADTVRRTRPVSRDECLDRCRQGYNKCNRRDRGSYGCQYEQQQCEEKCNR